MPADTVVAVGLGTREGEAMMRRGFGRLARWAAYVVTVVLALVLAGDRGRAAVVPATIYGQDPLEVLELKVRPNVIVVLDSSGSMKWGTTAPSGPASNFYPPQAGDHPRSKTFQAKQVLKQIVTNNQDKVSFMFGQYTQDAVIVMGNRNAATSSAANLTGERREPVHLRGRLGDVPVHGHDPALDPERRRRQRRPGHPVVAAHLPGSLEPPAAAGTRSTTRRRRRHALQLHGHDRGGRRSNGETFYAGRQGDAVARRRREPRGRPEDRHGQRRVLAGAPDDGATSTG